MSISKHKFLQPAIWLRVAADTALIQAAVAIALLLRYLGVYVLQNQPGSTDLRSIASDYVGIWCTRSVILTILCLVCPCLAGVYTRRRFYLGRFKALAVFQSVTMAFLIYGSLGYLLRPQSGLSVMAEIESEQRIPITDFPRTALVMAYVLTLGLLIGARTFIRIWHLFDHQPSATAHAPTQNAENRVLVVGGAGYIGSALVPQLLEAGYHVRVLDAMLFGTEPLAQVKDHERLEIVQGDFQRSSVLATAMKDVGTVVHLAGIVGDPACNLDERLTIQVNLSSTRTIAEMAKVAGIRRFVFASTCSVYGACDEILDEKSVAQPVSLYGNTKLISEQVLHELADETFSPTILRFATIYGLSGRTRFDLVVNLLSAKAKVDGQITVFNGQQWRPFVHVMDAAQSITLVVGAPLELVNDEVFNVGSNDQNHTILEIGKFVHQRVIGAELLVDDSDNDSRNYRVDFTKIRDFLAFEPKWTVDDGIQQVLDAISSGRVDDYRDPRYSNFAFLDQQGTSELAHDHWAVELIRGLESV